MLGLGLEIATEKSSFTVSGPITISSNNQVVQNQHITSTNGSAIIASGKSGVTIKNCVIHYAGTAPGISALNCSGFTVQDCTIVCDTNSAPGQGANSNLCGISLETCNNAAVTRVTTQDASVGVYVLTSDSVVVSFLKAVDCRGPSPRGQAAQFDHCTNCTLQDFWSTNNLTRCWTEDNVNCSNSTGMIIQRGLIDGNNSPTGFGVMMETSTGTITNVDAINWCNGAFGSSNSIGPAFLNCRARDFYTPCSQGRGAPSSNGLTFSAAGTSSGVIFRNCEHYLVPAGGTIFNGALCAEQDVFLNISFVKRLGYGAAPPIPTWTGPTTGLLHHWPMDDADVSGNTISDVVASGALNATGAGAGVTSTAGQNGYPGAARALLGSTTTGYASLASSPIASFTAAHSLFQWVQLADETQNGSGALSQRLCMFGTDSNNLVELLNRSGDLDIEYFGGGSNRSNQTNAPSSLANSGWHLVGYTFDGSSTVVIYVDNVAVATQAAAGSGTSTGVWLFGTKDGTNGNMTGRLGRAVIYDHVLSSSERSALFAAQ